MTFEDSFALGARIESDGFYGTIRYVGEVPPTRGMLNQNFLMLIMR